MKPSVAALFIDPKGPYPALGVDGWDQQRDALTYSGREPVICHPPCGRWCAMARLNEQRWGAKVGDDGGMFAFALATLRRNSGILEHPARSLAWPVFNLPAPKSIGWTYRQGFWVCEVWQSAYGHPAHKRTWLLYKGKTRPFDLDWRRDKTLATHQIGGGIHTGNRSRPRLDGAITHLTPLTFAKVLVRLAVWARHGK